MKRIIITFALFTFTVGCTTTRTNTSMNEVEVNRVLSQYSDADETPAVDVSKMSPEDREILNKYNQ